MMSSTNPGRVSRHAAFNAKLDAVQSAAGNLIDRVCTDDQRRAQAQQLRALIAAAQAALTACEE